MGLLDSFDDPGFLKDLLGFSPSQNSGGANPQSMGMPIPPSPPPSVFAGANMAPATPGPVFSGPQPGMLLPAQQDQGPVMQAPNLQQPDPAAHQRWQAGVDNDRANGLTATDTGGAPTGQVAANMPVPPDGGAGASARPRINIPVPVNGQPQPTMPPGTDLRSAFGLPPTGSFQGASNGPVSEANINARIAEMGSPWGRAMAGLGKGLTAVAGMAPGTTKGQNLAAGFGGALTGQREADASFVKDALASNNQFFNQTITDFNSKLKDEQFPYVLSELAARTARLNAMAGNGGRGTNAWQFTDIGRMHLAEGEAQKWYDAQLRALNLRKDFMGDDERKDALKDLDAKYEKMLQNKYKMYRVDPKSTPGTSQDNAIDVTGFPDAYRHGMPGGTYFKWKDPSTGQYRFGVTPMESQEEQQHPNAATNAADEYLLNSQPPQVT